MAVVTKPHEASFSNASHNLKENTGKITGAAVFTVACIVGTIALGILASHPIGWAVGMALAVGAAGTLAGTGYIIHTLRQKWYEEIKPKTWPKFEDVGDKLKEVGTKLKETANQGLDFAYEQAHKNPLAVAGASIGLYVAAPYIIAAVPAAAKAVLSSGFSLAVNAAWAVPSFIGRMVGIL